MRLLLKHKQLTGGVFFLAILGLINAANSKHNVVSGPLPNVEVV
jgi:hypothetical protein